MNQTYSGPRPLSRISAALIHMHKYHRDTFVVVAAVYLLSIALCLGLA